MTSTLIHPGIVLRTLLIDSEEYDSLSELARTLGVSTTTISRITNGLSEISTAIAVKLGRLPELEFTAEEWLIYQVRYNIQQYTITE